MDKNEIRAAVQELRDWITIIGCDLGSPDAAAAVARAISCMEVMRTHIERLERRDREAATYVEAPIVMRTRFTGEPPYVGWKGLGLALQEALDERDTYRKALEFYRDAWERHPGDSGPGGNTPSEPVCDPSLDLLEDGGLRAHKALKS